MRTNGYKLEFIFMKHYAPNRCLYKKNGRGGGGGGITIFKQTGGGVGFRWVGCDPIEGIIQLKQKKWGGGEGARSGGVNQELKVLLNLHIKGGVGVCEPRIASIVQLKKNVARDQELNVLYKRGGGGSHICLYCTTELTAIA